MKSIRPGQGVGLELHGMEIEEIPHRAAHILDGMATNDAGQNLSGGTE
jgi:hypothetical protein